jgi:DNA invertase Pin-like site-specific DNA recombinase
LGRTRPRSVVEPLLKNHSRLPPLKAHQVKQLRAVGAAKVYRETASGAKTERAQLRRVLDQLDAGDVLMVTRFDRVAR